MSPVIQALDLARFRSAFPRVLLIPVPCPSPRGCARTASQTVVPALNRTWIECSCSYLEAPRTEQEPPQILRC